MRGAKQSHKGNLEAYQRFPAQMQFQPLTHNRDSRSDQKHQDQWVGAPAQQPAGERRSPVDSERQVDAQQYGTQDQQEPKLGAPIKQKR
jgi:hypothetical protein